jgi:autotransporter-associated beta strand protein
LSWYSSAQNPAAHGNFTIGAANTFTLDAPLEDVSGFDWVNRGDWDGNSLTKLGAGTLILTAVNTYTGETEVNDGTLQIGNGGSIDETSRVVVGSSGNFEFHQSGDVVFDRVVSSTVSGTGSLTQVGMGTLTLTANNDNFTGTTRVLDGMLRIGDGGANGWVAGDIENNTDLVFHHSSIRTFNREISGSGTTTITGGVAGNGGLLVGDFAHRNTARIDNVVVVEGGATLGGHGSVGGLITLKEGAILSPGSHELGREVGEFTAENGIVFESGSIYRYEIRVGQNTVNSDLLVVQDGFATIHDGAQLEIVLSGIPKSNADPFQVIAGPLLFYNENGDVDDTVLFRIMGPLERRFRHEISSDSYSLIWKTLAEIVSHGTPNAIRAAEGVDMLGDRIPLSYYEALVIMETQELVDTFAQLHGEVFATSQETVARQQRRFQQLMPNGRELFSQVNMPTLWNRWGTFTGDWRRRENIGQYSGYDFSSAGFAVGIDRTVTQKLLLGAAIGYDHGWQDFKSIRSRSRIEAFRTMLYGSFYSGNYFLDAYGGYTKNCHRTKRHINIDSINFADNSLASFAATARSRYEDDMASVGLEFGRMFQLSGTTLTPYVGLHGMILNSPSVTETGGDFANLHVAKSKYRSLQFPIGIRANKSFVGKYGVLWMPEMRASFAREFADDSARVWTSFAGAPGSESFYADSGRWGLHSGRVGGGVGALVANRFNFRFDYDYEIYSRMTVHSCGATLGVHW